MIGSGSLWFGGFLTVGEHLRFHSGAEAVHLKGYGGRFRCDHDVKGNASVSVPDRLGFSVIADRSAFRFGNDILITKYKASCCDTAALHVRFELLGAFFKRQAARYNNSRAFALRSHQTGADGHVLRDRHGFVCCREAENAVERQVSEAVDALFEAVCRVEAALYCQICFRMDKAGFPILIIRLGNRRIIERQRLCVDVVACLAVSQNIALVLVGDARTAQPQIILGTRPDDHMINFNIPSGDFKIIRRCDEQIIGEYYSGKGSHGLSFCAKLYPFHTAFKNGLIV